MTDNEWRYPWKQPESVYDDGGPEQPVELELEGLRFHVARVEGLRGCNTGRPRYCVQCLTCRNILHEATTGPVNYIEDHIKNHAQSELGVDVFGWLQHYAAWRKRLDLGAPAVPPPPKLDSLVKTLKAQWDTVLDRIDNLEARGHKLESEPGGVGQAVAVQTVPADGLVFLAEARKVAGHFESMIESQDWDEGQAQILALELVEAAKR